MDLYKSTSGRSANEREKAVCVREREGDNV